MAEVPQPKGKVPQARQGRLVWELEKKPEALTFVRYLYIATGLLTRLPSKLSCLVVKCGFWSQT